MKTKRVRDDSVRSIVIFTFLALLFGTLMTVVRVQRHWPFPLEMWSPALAAAVVYGLVERRSLWSSEIRAHIIGRWRLWWLAWIPLPILALSFAIAALLNPSSIVRGTELTHGLRVMPGPLPMQIALILLVNLVVGPFINTFLVYLGEEIGWRGFLYPRLFERFGMLGLVIAGIIWGCWHAPMIALTGLNYPTVPWWIGTAYFTLFTIPAGAIVFYIYRRTESIIAAGLAHGAMDMTSPTIVFFLHIERLDPLVYGAGAVTIGLFWIAAAFIVRFSYPRLESPPSPRVHARRLLHG